MITGLQQLGAVRRVVHRRVRRGDQARERGDWLRAARQYKAALSLNPGLTPIWVQYGHALKESGRWKAAEFAYRKALAQDGGNPDTHLQLGHALKLQGRGGEAAVHYLVAQFLDPKLDPAQKEVAQLGYYVIDAATHQHFDELETELYGLRSDLQRAINHSGRLAAYLRDAEAAAQTSDTALTEAHKEFADQRRAQAELTEKLELQLYGLRSDLQRAVNYSSTLRTRLRMAEDAIEPHRTAQQEAETGLRAAQTELDAQRQQIAELNRSLETSARAAAEAAQAAAGERAALLEESDALRAALADAQENAEAARAAYGASESALHAAREAAEAAAVERQALAVELDARQGRLDELQRELAESQQALQEARETAARERDSAVAQQARIDQLQGELTASQRVWLEAREVQASTAAGLWRQDFNSLQANLLGRISLLGSDLERVRRAVEPTGRAANTGNGIVMLRDSYLDLLENALTGRLYDDPNIGPFADPGYNPDVRLIGWDWPARAQTMIGLARMRNVRQLLESVLEEEIAGDLLEAGVWRGGACIYMRGILAAYGITDRRVWVADSFAGLPPPDPENYPADAVDIHNTFKELCVPIEEVKANFSKYNLLDSQVIFLKGWFKDTLPGAAFQRLALLRLDGDMYQSTMEALQATYNKVSPGGYIIIDDYILPGARKAVHDFREQCQLREEIYPIDGAGAYWRKSC